MYLSKQQLFKEYEKVNFKLYLVLKRLGYVKRRLEYQERINNKKYNRLYRNADKLVGYQLKLEEKL